MSKSGLASIENAIGGARVVSRSTRTQGVFNPATGEQTAVLPLSSAAEVAEAIAAAKAAFPAWRDTPPLKRARMMFRFKELLSAHADDIARRSRPNTARPMTMRWARWRAASRWWNSPAASRIS